MRDEPRSALESLVELWAFVEFARGPPAEFVLGLAVSARCAAEDPLAARRSFELDASGEVDAPLDSDARSPSLLGAPSLQLDASAAAITSHVPSARRHAPRVAEADSRATSCAADFE